MKAYFYWNEPLKTREITEAEFSSTVKKIEAYGLDPLEFIDIAHTVINGGLVIEVYLKITSDKLTSAGRNTRTQNERS